MTTPTLVPPPRTAGVLLALAAVGEVVEQLVSPLTGGDTRQDLGDIAAHQGAFVLSVLIGTISTLLYAPGLLGFAQACAGRSPRTARVAGWASVAAMGGFFAIRLGQALELSGVRHGLGHRELASAVDGTVGNPIGLLVIVVFLPVGWVGMVALCVAGWRAGLPRPACLALPAFGLLDLVVPSQPVPWSHLLLLAALAWLARALWQRDRSTYAVDGTPTPVAA